MQIYNARSIDRNSRFIIAIFAGLAAAIVGGILYGAVYSFIHIQAAIMYVFIGWCIGQVIRNVGRGVTLKFSILGAIMTLLAIMIGDFVAIVGLGNTLTALVTPSLWGDFIRIWLAMNLSTNLSSILGLVLRALGIYMGYLYARIL